jgi:hypothetical protein
MCADARASRSKRLAETTRWRRPAAYALEGGVMVVLHADVGVDGED